MPTLPSGWEAKWDQRYSRWYYINHSTKVTQWNPPTNTNDESMDEVLNLFTPDDMTLKNLITDMFGRHGNDKQLVINDLLSMGYTFHVEKAESEPVTSEVEETDEEREKLAVMMKEEIEKEREERRRLKEEERKREEAEAKAQLEESRKKMEQARKKAELLKKELSMKYNMEHIRLGDTSLSSSTPYSVPVNQSCSPKEIKIRPQKTSTPASYASKLANGPAGINVGPDEELRYRPVRALACGPDISLRCGPNQLLVNGPGESLLYDITSYVN